MYIAIKVLHFCLIYLYFANNKYFFILKYYCKHCNFCRISSSTLNAPFWRLVSPFIDKIGYERITMYLLFDLPSPLAECFTIVCPGQRRNDHIKISEGYN